MVAEHGEFVPTARPGVVGVQGPAADVQIELGDHEPMLTGTSHPGVNIASSANTVACNEKHATDNLARQNKIAADLSARQRSVVLPAGRAEQQTANADPDRVDTLLRAGKRSDT